MKKIFFIFILLILSSNISFAINKNESLYQEGKPLHEWTFIAGKWIAWMKSCQGNGKFAQEIKMKVANLSWPDFKKLGAGESEFENKFIAGRCIESEVKAGKGYLKKYTRELSDLVKTKTNRSLNNTTEEKKETIYCQRSNGTVYTRVSGNCNPDKKIKKQLYLDIKKEKRAKKNEDINKKQNSEERLTKLKLLYEKKLITKEDYDSKRKEILDEL